MIATTWRAAQLVALAHPCLLAGETVHPRFARRTDHGATVIVTVNRGYE